VNNLGKFLERFKQLKPPERTVQQAVVSAIQEVVGVEIVCEDVVVVRGAVRLQVGPVVRTEIRMREQEVLERVAAAIGSGRVCSIK